MDEKRKRYVEKKISLSQPVHMLALIGLTIDKQERSLNLEIEISDSFYLAIIQLFGFFHVFYYLY